MRSDLLAGVSVAILNAGQKLPEYDGESLQDEENTTAAYIQSVPGAEFTVQIYFDDAYPYRQQGLKARLILDGNHIVTSLCYKGKLRNIAFPGVTRGYDEKTTFQKLTFAELKTTEDPVKISDRDAIANLGNVDVKIYRCDISKGPDHDRGKARPGTMIESVPEKALKGRAISAHATLGKDEPHRARERWRKGNSIANQVLLATYSFKCRSRRDLEIEGILSRDPSPLPLEERNLEDLQPEELRYLLRRQRDLGQPVKQEGKRMKRERSTTIISDGENSDGDADIEVIAEGSRRKRPRTDSEMDIIDLSAD